MAGAGFLWQVPDPGAAAAVVAVVTADQGVAVDVAVARAGVALGHDHDDPVARRVVERALRVLVDRSDLVLLAPDRVVAPLALLEGSVLTHRLTDDEVRGDHLSLACDLAPFAYGDSWRSPDTDLELVGLADGLPAWLGDDGWLADRRPGDLVAVRLLGEGAVVVDVVDPAAVPTSSPALDVVAERLGAAYRRERADPHLPALVDDLVFAVLVEDPSAFAAPGPPLGELLGRAGLDHRGPLVAHDATVWLHQARADRRRRVAEVIDDDPELVDTVVEVLDVADLASGAIAVDIALGPLDDALVDRVLDDLDDLDVLAVASGELLRTSDLVDQRAIRVGFVDALTATPRAPRREAVARYLAALVAQLDGDAGRAQDHLAVAHRVDPTYVPAADLFAYYASVGGDREAAEQRWAACPPSPVIRTELEVLRALPAAPTLAARVAWVQRKLVGFLARSEPAREALAEVAFARTVDPTDEAQLRATIEDPLVDDVVLHEAGWFGRFLVAMGPLLPDDERTLLHRWVTRDRALYEVEATGPGGSLRLAPRGGGPAVEVAAAVPPRSHGPGRLDPSRLVCGRIVPLAEGHGLRPGWFVVPPDVADDVAEILAEGDAVAVALVASELDLRWRAAAGDAAAIDLRDHLRAVDR